jgi:GMP synthase PP-ATPase subunit
LIVRCATPAGNSRLTCVFVNNGVLRKNESRESSEGPCATTLQLGLTPLTRPDRFFGKLKRRHRSEKKQDHSATNSSKCLKRKARRIEKERRVRSWLVQGTLYPDGSRRGQCGASAQVIVPPQRRRAAREEEAR